MTRKSRRIALSTLAGLVLPVTMAGAFDASREDVRLFMEEMRERHGFTQEWLDGVIGTAASDGRILELISRPAERVRPWHEYRAHFLTEQRIAEGVAFWSAHRARLAEVERETGVPARIIVGILGVETFYGRITGRFRVLDALATLAFDYPPRSPYFRTELEQFLLLGREEPRVDLLAAQGSYAGAMGRPQFMPRSYRVFAVDGDGDGRRDLWQSWDDTIASIANYLAGHGWRAGEPVETPARLWYADAGRLVAGSIEANETVDTLRDKGLAFETVLAGDAPAVFIRVDGTDGPELRAGFHNFSVIAKYNRSVMYALAVSDLGASVEARLQLAGGG